MAACARFYSSIAGGSPPGKQRRSGREAEPAVGVNHKPEPPPQLGLVRGCQAAGSMSAARFWWTCRCLFTASSSRLTDLPTDRGALTRQRADGCSVAGWIPAVPGRLTARLAVLLLTSHTGQPDTSHRLRVPHVCGQYCMWNPSREASDWEVGGEIPFRVRCGGIMLSES
ncbi:unnamed protein product [Pleuronectes platessa]|uniref:Uncharacterized protein n=1 Tax=Pleuronectes platessa TaxID=8262 RepID=A0A9N7ULQ5_PLEPL|nr:unnamed protein product [Pleuronectes platessa]